MIQNINSKWLTFFLCLTLTYTLNGQQIDTLKSEEMKGNCDTTNRRVTVSFGINLGYNFNKSSSTGWLKGNYSTLSTPSIGLSFRLNLGKNWRIGTGLNRYNIQFSAIEHLIATVEAPSTIASEPNYLLDYKGRVRVFCNAYEIPFEIAYKFNKKWKCFKPMISIGTIYTHYFSPFIEDLPYEYTPFTRRISGSVPVEEKILHPNLNRFTFSYSNKIQFLPFVTIGAVRAFSKHSFLRLNTKFAFNQKTANSILQSKLEDVVRTSDFKMLQMGLIAEYFITF